METELDPEAAAAREVASAASGLSPSESEAPLPGKALIEIDVAPEATAAVAGYELPGVSAPPVEAKLPPVPVEFRTAEVVTAPKAEAVLAPPDSPAPQQPEASVAAPIEIARVAPAEAPAPAARKSEAVVTTDGDLRTIEDSLRRNEWLAKSLRRHGIPTEVATRISHEVGDTFDFRQARAGQRYRITQDADGGVVEFDFEIAPGDELSLRRIDGRYQVSRSGR